MNANLWLPTVCQALFLVNVTFIAINGLVGLSLAPQGWTLLNLGSLLPIAAVMATVLWLMLKRPAAVRPV